MKRRRKCSLNLKLMKTLCSNRMPRPPPNVPAAQSPNAPAIWSSNQNPRYVSIYQRENMATEVTIMISYDLAVIVKMQ